MKSNELEAYTKGIHAAYRTHEYEGITEPPDDSPYLNGSKEDEAWWKGFGDGTEDLSWQQWEF